MRTRILSITTTSILMIALLGLVVTGHSESDPYITDLLAGQDIDVGDVEIWNDEDNLYIKYVTTGSWELVDIHLEVSLTLDGIPQKKDNPIPGKFEYKAKGLWTNEHIVPPIPLEGNTGDDLYIAAHAKVVDTSSTAIITAASQPGIDVHGPIAAYASLGDVAWGTVSSAVAAWVHPSWPNIADATWISTAYYTEDSADSWRWFQEQIEIPGYPVSGSIDVSATSDNAEEFYFNGALIGSDGEVQGPFTDNHEWNTIINYGIDPEKGTNTLDFIVRNYGVAGTPTTNPTGLIYRAEIEYYDVEETAWGDGTEFPGKNWATYITYTIQGWQLKETLTVPATTDIPTVSTTVLESGKLYKIEAEGTYFFRNEGSPLGYLADAEWALRYDAYGTGWTKGDTYPNPNGLDLCESLVTNIDWGDLDEADHRYSIQYIGAGSTISLFIRDSYHGDNSGQLTVRIYEWG